MPSVHRPKIGKFGEIRPRVRGSATRRLGGYPASHEAQSGPMRRNQAQSGAIRRNQLPSSARRCAQVPSGVIRRHQQHACTHRPPVECDRTARRGYPSPVMQGALVVVSGRPFGGPERPDDGGNQAYFRKKQRSDQWQSWAISAPLKTALEQQSAFISGNQKSSSHQWQSAHPSRPRSSNSFARPTRRSRRREPARTPSWAASAARSV